MAIAGTDSDGAQRKERAKTKRYRQEKERSGIGHAC